MGVSELGTLAGDGSQFQAPAEKCPYAPALAAPSHTNPIVPPAGAAIFAGLLSHPAVMAETESEWRIARDRSRQKRGPPVVLT